jgi:uncharacterized protein YndB with AHSA1/START domain
MATPDTTATPLLEMSVTRHIDAPPERVWQVMTERTAEWWCPLPWRAEVIEQDLRPGGRSAMRMRGPAGEQIEGEGVFLEVTPGKRLVFTDAFKAGWLPQAPFMLGYFEIAPEGAGTRYRAGARHWDAEKMEEHRGMGFEQGWTTVAAQLAAMCEAAD